MSTIRDARPRSALREQNIEALPGCTNLLLNLYITSENLYTIYLQNCLKSAIIFRIDTVQKDVVAVKLCLKIRRDPVLALLRRREDDSIQLF
jgi:hypothetical protein